MSSSLASQLAGIGSLDAARLSAATAKSRPSFLFSPRQAASLSNSEIHALGYNGFLSLLSEDPRLERYETPLFGEKAKTTDRALLNKEENAKLDRIIAGLIRAVAGKFLVKNTGKVIEWLIRRFRINEFNVDDVLALVLPYHETPQFAQMLQILNLQDEKFTALEAVKKSLQPLPRHHLLTAMVKSHNLFLWIANLLKPYIAEGSLHAALVSFWTASLVGYIDRLSFMNENQMLVLLPVIVDGLKTASSNDVRMGACLILSRMAPKVEFSNEAMDVLINALISRQAASAVEYTEEGDAGIEALVTTLVILCESQRSKLELLPKKALSSLLRTNGAMDAIVSLSSNHSAAKLLQPLFISLIEASKTDEKACTALISILSPVSCPEQITAVALPLLLGAASVGEEPDQSVIQALSVISQRDSDAYYSACENAQKGKTPEERAAIRKIMASVSGYGLFSSSAASNGSAASADADLALSLASNEAQVRAQALSQILSAATVTEEAIPAPLMSILLERLADPATAVASILLATEHVAVASRLAKQAPGKVFAASLSLVNEPETPRAIILLHLSFLMNGYIQAVPERRTEVLQGAFWPRLLATKSNAKLCKGVWNLVKDNEETFPLLQGCVGVLNVDAEKEDLPAQNEQLAAKIAENATAADSDFLVGVLAGPSSSTSKILAALVLAKIAAGKGDAQIIARILAATASTSILAQVTQSLPSSAATAAIFAKPTSSKTINTVLGELRFSALLSISAPEAGKWCWLYSALSSESEAYKKLAYEAYRLAHTAGTAPEASDAILTTLFTRAVQEDALAFLSSIYTSAQQPLSLRLVALKDALAYLAANEQAVAGKAGHNDLQTILPGIAVALSAAEKEVRQAALSVLEHVARMAKKGIADQRIYGFDCIYGSSSGNLQYLQVEQVYKLSRVLLDGKTELLLDGPGALRLLLSTKLDEPGVSKKKSLSHAVLCYIASHAVAWSDVLARTALLASVRDIPDSGRTDLYKPLLKAEEQANVPQNVLDEYAILVAEAFSTLPKAGLQEDTLAAFLDTLQSRQTDNLAVALRKQARERVRLTLFKAFSPAQRLVLLERLVALLLSPVPSEATALRQLVNTLNIDADTLVAYLSQIGQSFSNTSSSAGRTSSGKKARSVSTSGAPSESSATQAGRLGELGALLENIDAARVEVSIQLLCTMLEMLGALVDLNVSHQVEVAYHAQLLMAAATSVTLRLAEQSPSQVAEGIRINPVMEMIRISNNPATSNQALTLIAELVKLVPDQVVQNIMPIFTFMGTNVFQRDDAYSSRVVDKTIESIVPALVKDRSKRALTREHLLTEMSDFMRVFADAANHVPRHRRNRLFIRFAEVLGPQTFLAPLCSLLVDKVALRYAKSSDVTLLALPLAVCNHFSASIQMIACHQLLGDLVAKVQLLNTEASDGSLASRQSTPTTPAESPALPVSASRRTVLASLAFLNNVISAKTLASQVDKSRAKDSEDLDVTIQDLMKTATAFYTIPPQKLSASDMAQLLDHVQTFILSAGRLLTVSAFSEVTEWAIKDEDTRVVEVAYGLLVARLKTVKAAGRPNLSPSVLSAMDRLRGYLQTPSGRFDKIRSLNGLRSLSVMASDDEIQSVSTTLSAVLALAEVESSKSLLSQAMAYICENIPRLGARIIPSVSRIVSLAIKLLKQSVAARSDKGSLGISVSSFLALAALFQTVPTFIAAQLQAILQLCVQTSVRTFALDDKSGKLSMAISSLMTAATKKVPPKSLFTSVAQLLEKVDKTSAIQVSGIQDILVRSLRAVSATTFGDVYKQAFAILMSLFDTRRQAAIDTEEVLAIENTAISAYMQMVLKLNEGTFRPLFLRLFDWAVMDLVNDQAGATQRKVTLFRVMDRMLAQLKTIAVPYYSYMLDQVVEILGEADHQDLHLLDAVMSSLKRAFEHDTIGFWTANRLAKLVQPIAKQGLAAEAPNSRSSDSYSNVLTAFAQAIEAHESTLHDLIKTFLDQTRSESQEQQLAALRSLQTLWDAGIDASMAAHSAECMPYLVETLEAGGKVARATKDLLARMNEDAGQSSEGSDDDSEDDGEDLGEEDEEELD